MKIINLTARITLSVERHLQRLRRRLASVDALPQLAVMGLLAGIATGIVSILFRVAFELPLSWLLPEGNSENFEGLPMESRLAFPILGAIVVGIILRRLPAKQRLFGVPLVMDRLNSHQGHIPLSNALHQFLLGVLTIVSGQSAGREGPAVHLGAASSSLLGQGLRLPNNSIRILVGCGTAAAISASFNTPIAGVIFAMEVVLMEYSISGFTPVILSAVSAAVLNQIVYGNMPAFNIPAMSLHSLFELPFIVGMGVVFALCSTTFVRTLRFAMRFNHRPVLLRLSVAGIMTACVALVAPQVMGVGYDTVSSSIAGDLSLSVLVLIGVAKLLLTPASIGLGMPSGIIGPTLFIGATLGAAMGVIAQQLMPGTASSIGLYSMLGMGAMMGAVLQAPLSALMAVMELTRNTQIMLPAMLIIVVASLTTAHFFKQRSVFLETLDALGLDYHGSPLSMALRRIGVSAMMDRNFARTKVVITLAEAHVLLANSPKWLLVENESGRPLLLAAAELVRAMEAVDITSKNTEDTLIFNLNEIPAQRKDLTPIHSQATLEEALVQLNSKNVDALYVETQRPTMHKETVGILTRSDIETFYQLKNSIR